MSEPIILHGPPTPQSIANFNGILNHLFNKGRQAARNDAPRTDCPLPDNPYARFWYLGWDTESRNPSPPGPLFPDTQPGDHP